MSATTRKQTISELRIENERLRQLINSLTIENARLIERLQEYREDSARVLAEQCAADERHCACVPVLRAEIERLDQWQALNLGFVADENLTGLVKLLANWYQMTRISANAESE